MFACPNRAEICDGTCSDCPQRKIKTRAYVFLDIDGVINSNEYFETDEYTNANLSTGFDVAANQICEILVHRLNALAVEGVAFVLSSNWRGCYTVKQVQDMLRSRGFRGTLIGATPLINVSRGKQIASWIESNLSREERAISEFVILDDRDDMEYLRSKLIQTSIESGLQDSHVELAKKMLGITVFGLTASQR